MELGKMSYKDIILSICDEHLGMKCMETLQIASSSNEEIVCDLGKPSNEFTYKIISYIAKGKVNSAHFSSEEAKKLIHLINRYSKVM